MDQETLQKLASSGWADFHTEFKIPRGVRKQLRRWVDRLKWPENHEKHDAREYHITVVDMEEYDEDFAKWAKKRVEGKTLVFKSVGMDMFNDFVVVRLDCPVWDEIARDWTDEAERRGLEPHKFPGGPKAHVSVGRSFDKKWPRGIPNPNIKFETRMFNIKRNSGWHEAMAVDPEFVQNWMGPTDSPYGQRYLYHGRQEHPDIVRANGIDTGMAEYHPTPSVYLSPNPGLAEHYAEHPGSEVEYPEEEEFGHPGSWVYQIDPSKLDPTLIEADEWNVQDPYPEGHEYHGEGYGMTPEMLEHVGDPDVTRNQWQSGNALAYRGTIPPEAIVDHYQMVNGEPQEWNSDLEATAKVSKWHVSVPVSNEWHEEQPPLYHGTSLANARRIMAEGLKPWDDPSIEQKWGNEFEHDWYEPRPGHVYLAQNPSRAQSAATDRGSNMDWAADEFGEEEPHEDDGKSVVLKIDPRHLDPRNINPDEDASGKLHENPWEEANLSDPDWEPEHRTLGEWAENTGWGDDTAQSEKEINRYGTMAYRGVIPPEAISVHSILEPEPMAGKYNMTREIWKPANELPPLQAQQQITGAIEQEPADELAQWLQSFETTPATQPSPHHIDADQFQPQIVAPVVQTPHIDPPKKPYKPYNWAEEGWEESPMDREAASADEEAFVPGMAAPQPLRVIPHDWSQTRYGEAPEAPAAFSHHEQRQPFLYDRDEGTVHLGEPGMIHEDLYDMGLGYPRTDPNRWHGGEVSPVDPTQPRFFYDDGHRSWKPDGDRILEALRAYTGQDIRRDTEWRQTTSNTHRCPQCDAMIDGQICNECGYDPFHADSDYDKAKNEWYDRAWSHPEDQPMRWPPQPHHWREDHASDISLASVSSSHSWHGF